MSRSKKIEKRPTHAVSRRDVLRTAAVSGGIVVSKWSTPVVEGIVVPAHATTTLGPPPQGFDQTTISSFSIIAPDLP